jgi:hypothetical protein
LGTTLELALSLAPKDWTLDYSFLLYVPITAVESEQEEGE